MKVILLKNMDRLGNAGEIVEVTPGYGRNYLVPMGIAEVLTRKGQKQVEIRTRLAEKRAQMELDQAQELASKIEGSSFDVKAKVGARGKLYGSITTQAVADAVGNALDAKIDKRYVTILEPIRILGSYDVSLKLHPDIQVEFKVNVTAAEGSKMATGLKEE